MIVQVDRMSVAGASPAQTPKAIVFTPPLHCSLALEHLTLSDRTALLIECVLGGFALKGPGRKVFYDSFPMQAVKER